MGKTILLVEDDQDSREALRSILEDEGYEVLTAANGAHALEVLRGARPPDLILLDWRMPVMSGNEFRSQQLLDPTLSHIPVIVMSADRRIREESVALDIADIVEKPPELDELLACIRRHCAPENDHPSD